MKKTQMFVAAFAAFALLVGFMWMPASVITIKGSDTMVQLAQRWAEKYMKDHSSVQIQVTGGGSGTGISALINGTTEICLSSRPMKDSEKLKLRERYGTTGIEVRTAKDGLTVFTHNGNPVKELSFAQLRDIYTGKIKNWKDVGGKDASIILYGRENSSGTYAFFKEHVLSNADYSNGMQALPGTAAVVNAVRKDQHGIGFGGAGYAEGVKEVAVRQGATGTAYLPTKENVASGVYPITRFLYFYLRQKPSGTTQEFIKWILGAEGQAIVTKEGFFPVK
ncbi:MAG TPA: phosphate ABC transporter substrate-binding protein [Candidatus Kapabacteria bacterium]|nr:phosphate ABC transporter substrate-binding protein [Candidatus Kapabacteria bacterium]